MKKIMKDDTYKRIVDDISKIGRLSINDHYFTTLHEKWNEIPENTLRSIIGLWIRRHVIKQSPRVKSANVYELYKTTTVDEGSNQCMKIAEDFLYPPALISKIIVEGYLAEKYPNLKITKPKKNHNRLKLANSFSEQNQKSSFNHSTSSIHPPTITLLDFIKSNRKIIDKNRDTENSVRNKPKNFERNNAFTFENARERSYHTDNISDEKRNVEQDITTSSKSLHEFDGNDNISDGKRNVKQDITTSSKSSHEYNGIDNISDKKRNVEQKITTSFKSSHEFNGNDNIIKKLELLQKRVTQPSNNKSRKRRTKKNNSLNNSNNEENQSKVTSSLDSPECLNLRKNASPSIIKCTLEEEKLYVDGKISYAKNRRSLDLSECVKNTNAKICDNVSYVKKSHVKNTSRIDDEIISSKERHSIDSSECINTQKKSPSEIYASRLNGKKSDMKNTSHTTENKIILKNTFADDSPSCTYTKTDELHVICDKKLDTQIFPDEIASLINNKFGRSKKMRSKDSSEYENFQKNMSPEICDDSSNDVLSPTENKSISKRENSIDSTKCVRSNKNTSLEQIENQYSEGTSLNQNGLIPRINYNFNISQSGCGNNYLENSNFRQSSAEIRENGVKDDKFFHKVKFNNRFSNSNNEDFNRSRNITHLREEKFDLKSEKCFPAIGTTSTPKMNIKTHESQKKRVPLVTLNSRSTYTNHPAFKERDAIYHHSAQDEKFDLQSETCFPAIGTTSTPKINKKAHESRKKRVPLVTLSSSSMFANHPTFEEQVQDSTYEQLAQNVGASYAEYKVDNRKEIKSVLVEGNNGENDYKTKNCTKNELIKEQEAIPKYQARIASESRFEFKVNNQKASVLENGNIKEKIDKCIKNEIIFLEEQNIVENQKENIVLFDKENSSLVENLNSLAISNGDNSSTRKKKLLESIKSEFGEHFEDEQSYEQIDCANIRDTSNSKIENGEGDAVDEELNESTNEETECVETSSHGKKSHDNITVSKFVTNPFLIEDPKLAGEIFECISFDDQYGPVPETRKTLIGIEYEKVLAKCAAEMGLVFRCESEMRQEGYDKTPDLTLIVPFAINGVIINWIESKALFADERAHSEYKTNQYSGYYNRFGPGMVIYWFGVVDSVRKKQEKHFVVKGHFPKKEEIEFYDPWKCWDCKYLQSADGVKD